MSKLKFDTNTTWDLDSSGILSPKECLKAEIPTKLSQLDNDRYFISDKYYIHTDNNFTTEYKEILKELIDTEDLGLKNVSVVEKGLLLSKLYLFTPSENNSSKGRFVEYSPIKNISELNNDLNFIDNTISDLLNYYTKTDVDDLLSNLSRLKLLVVNELPTTNISLDTIYLLREKDGTCVEYVYINDTWEIIGSTKIDLSIYALKTELDSKLSKKLDKQHSISDKDKTLIVDEHGTLNLRKIKLRTSKLVDIEKTLIDPYGKISELGVKIVELTESKQDAKAGHSLVSDIEIERLALVDNYNDVDIRNIINGVKATINTVDDKLDEVEDDVNIRIDNVNTNLSNTNVKLSDTNIKLSKTNTKLDNAISDIDIELNNISTKLEDTLGEISTILDNING